MSVGGREYAHPPDVGRRFSSAPPAAAVPMLTLFAVPSLASTADIARTRAARESAAFVVTQHRRLPPASACRLPRFVMRDFEAARQAFLKMKTTLNVFPDEKSEMNRYTEMRDRYCCCAMRAAML